MDAKDELTESFALMHCSKKEFEQLPPDAIIRSIEQPYQVDVLVKKADARYTYDAPTLEDWMRMYTKGEKR